VEFPEDLKEYMTQEFLVSVALSALKLVVVLILAIVLLRVVKFVIDRWKSRLTLKRSAAHPDETDLEKEKRLETITNLVRKGLNILVISMAILVGLQTVGVSIGPLLASAGVLGLAIGFGAQNIVQDVISGFFLLFEDQVREGDVAVINGQGGTVEQINFRTIVLRDMAGTVHYFRNGSINTVANMTKGWSAMVFEIGVAYKEDLNKVMEVMKESFKKLKNNDQFAPNILEDIEIFGLDSFGDSALVIKARIKTSPLQQWAIGRAYRQIIKEDFDRENIEIPFPHQSIYFGDASAPFNVNINQTEQNS